MKFSRKVIVKLSSFFIIGGFIISHVTPSISVRTHLFATGYPIGAFRVNVHINQGQYDMDAVILHRENAMIYIISGYNLYDRETGNLLCNYKVKKIGFLYFAEMYGNG